MRILVQLAIQVVSATATIRRTMLTAAQAIIKLRRNGCKRPIFTYYEAKRAGIPVSVLAAVLDQESGGGKNVWGHDPTIFAGGYDKRHDKHYGETITKAGYLAYKAQRGSHGQGGMQGVGPMQLTWYAYQDKADHYGGCWNVRFNIRVGAEMLRDEYKTYKSWFTAFWHYNGSQTYAKQVDARYVRWSNLLGGL
jgi:hypothetical protein